MCYVQYSVFNSLGFNLYCIAGIPDVNYLLLCLARPVAWLERKHTKERTHESEENECLYTCIGVQKVKGACRGGASLGLGGA